MLALKNFCVIAFVLLSHFGLQGQNLIYDILKGDKIIGSLEVTQSISGSRETISMKNLVEYRVLLKFTVNFTSSETFEEGVLVQGEGFNTLNGITQKETSIKLKDNGYHLLIDGVAASNESKPIKNSMSKIYHVEPYDGKKLYSQYFGVYLTAEKAGDHKYTIESEDGENVYIYENGYCSEVKIYRDYATLHIKIRPESVASIKAYQESHRNK